MTKVVIEIKRAKAVPGSNDLLDLASRVAAQPGRRFELIALPSSEHMPVPDLAWADEDAAKLLDEGLKRPAFFFVNTIIEKAVVLAATGKHRSSVNPPFAQLLRDLVVRGVIDDDDRQRIVKAREKQDAISHQAGEPMPTHEEVRALMNLSLRLQRDLFAAGERSSA